MAWKFWNRKTPSALPYFVRRGFGVSGGVPVSEETAMKVSAFYRGVVYISTQIGKLPWQIKDQNDATIENDLTYLLDLAPNGEMSAMYFKIWIIQQAIITGNGFAEIERAVNGKPIALWPIDSRRVQLKRDASGRLYYYVSGGNNVSGDPVSIYPKDMFHVKNFHTLDGLAGQGLVAYARDTLGISIAADRMASAMFANAGLPSVVLKHPGQLSDEAYKRVKDSWVEQNGGGKTGGVSILEEGLSVEALNMDPQVLQFLDSRKFGVIEIARFLGLPPSKLYDQSNPRAAASVEQTNMDVAIDTLDIWANALEVEADIKLLNNRYGGNYTEMDLYYINRGDMATRANYFFKMMQVAAMSPNEIRSAEGRAGMGKEGDRYYLATNNFTPLDRMDEVIDAQISSGKGNSNNPNNEVSTDPAKKDLPAKAQDPLQIAAIKFLERK